MAGCGRTEYSRTRNAGGVVVVVVVVVADSASSGGSGAVQGAFNGDILVLAAQVRDGLEEAIAEKGEQVVANARIRGHNIREFVLKRGEKWRLNVDHIIAIGDRATVIGIWARPKLRLVDADAIRIGFGK
jgi:hypothetical protein